MTVTMESQSRHLSGLPFDHMSYPSSGSQFSSPWAGSSSSSSSHMFSSSLAPSSHGYDPLHKDQPTRDNSSLQYNSMPASQAPLAPSGSYYSQPEALGMSQDLLSAPRSSYEHSYPATTSTTIHSYAPTSAPYTNSYGGLQPQPNTTRRLSRQSVGSPVTSSESSYNDALDAGRGMLAMSQDLTTPRNVYGSKSDRSTPDSYFPSSHSSHSSVSSSSTYPYDYTSSVSGYSSQSEMGDTASRTLPAPSGMVGGAALPAPSSMMGQFNSKISSSTQKKHKCKVCDKRFTRPSSLQTHMYSHTGEKPFACEYEGCGRHFSVVSNLRRHKKVHKGEGASDHESPEGSWVTEN